MTTIFMMERELRGLKNRGHFPIPTITPQGTKFGNPQQAKRILEAVDEEMVEILTRIREKEKACEKGQEAARKQARTTHNFPSLNSSTPIKNTGTTENRQQLPHISTLTPYTNTTMQLNQLVVPIGTNHQPTIQ